MRSDAYHNDFAGLLFSSDSELVTAMQKKSPSTGKHVDKQ